MISSPPESSGGENGDSSTGLRSSSAIRKTKGATLALLLADGTQIVEKGLEITGSPPAGRRPGD